MILHEEEREDEREKGRAERREARPHLWEQVAGELADHFAVDAAERDRAGEPPLDEVAHIRESGLLDALVPPAPGGGGLAWPDACRIVRRMAAADSSLAELLGRHYVLAWSGRLLAPTDPGAWWETHASGRGHLLAGRIGPEAHGDRSFDDALTLTADDHGHNLSGRSVPVPGARVADRVLLSARRAGTRESHVVVLIDPRGATVTTEPVDDLFGQRLTGVGTLHFAHAHVGEEHTLGTVAGDEDLTSPLAALAPLALRMMTAHVVLGIAEGALDEARDAILATFHTRSPAPRRHHPTRTAEAADPDLLQTYGELAAAAHVSTAVVEHATHALAGGIGRGERLDSVHGSRIAASVATAEASASEAALRITARVLELADAAHLDRFWRNARSLTAHRALARELRAIGEHFLYAPARPHPSGA
ncbi:acyl-CoA dehydrogenase family protein [Streptomyces reniochalinae]|uniref:acyl-CoA dehydrogenase family protein n=1 Tax=Streptomyces reniochalinae TaxID=2250578 RepID=UPI0015F01359|nr:acyl-CoA dehydrogenase family protein [Streptomyces reniochalinae]